MIADTKVTQTNVIKHLLTSPARQSQPVEHYTHDPELYEIINGEKLYMDATGGEHGWVELNVASAIRDHVRPQRLGRVQVGEVGIYIQRNPDRVRAADVLFISLERYARLSNPDGYLDVAPELVVEVLSPDDTVIGMMQKLRDYFSIGVRLVWLIDPAAHTVLAYRSLTNVREFTETDILPGEDVLPGFAVAVASLFEA